MAIQRWQSGCPAVGVPRVPRSCSRLCPGLRSQPSAPARAARAYGRSIRSRCVWTWPGGAGRRSTDAGRWRGGGRRAGVSHVLLAGVCVSGPRREQPVEAPGRERDQARAGERAAWRQAWCWGAAWRHAGLPGAAGACPRALRCVYRPRRSPASGRCARGPGILTAPDATRAGAHGSRGAGPAGGPRSPRPGGSGHPQQGAPRWRRAERPPGGCRGVGAWGHTGGGQDAGPSSEGVADLLIWYPLLKNAGYQLCMGDRDYPSAAWSVLPRDGYCASWHNA